MTDIVELHNIEFSMSKFANKEYRERAIAETIRDLRAKVAELEDFNAAYQERLREVDNPDYALRVDSLQRQVSNLHDMEAILVGRINVLKDDKTKAQERIAELEKRAVMVPEGWKLVPVDPTKEMLWAITPASAKLSEWKQNYASMLQDAPTPPTGEPSVKDSFTVEKRQDHFRAATKMMETRSEIEALHRANALAATIRELRDVVTHGAETKDDFIARVREILGSDPDLRVEEIEAKALEEAAQLCETSDRYRGDYFAEKIRQLAEKKKEV